MKKFARIKKNAYLCTRKTKKSSSFNVFAQFRDVAQSG